MATTNPSYESDCKEIHDSWGRLSHLAQSLAGKSQLERRQIREAYMAMYGEDLIHRLQNTSRAVTTSSSQRKELGASPTAAWVVGSASALSLWMLDPIERDVAMAREALDEQTSDSGYEALVEMFVGRKSSHLVLISQGYQARFRRQLERDIACIESSHPYKKILVALVASHKALHADVSQHIAKCDARRLYQTGEGRPGPIDEAVVQEILSKRSIPQLKLTFSCYKHIYGHNYAKSLKNENYGEFEDALKVVVQCMYNPPKYYAKVLYASMKGMTKDKGALARVMVSRAEVDMDEIQRIFKEKYGMQLREAICESIPSGDHRDFLVALATKTTTLPSALSS